MYSPTAAESFRMIKPNSLGEIQVCVGIEDWERRTHLNSDDGA